MRGPFLTWLLRAYDVLLPIVVGGFLFAIVGDAYEGEEAGWQLLAGLVLSVVSGGALWWRKEHPEAVAAVVITAGVAYHFLVPEGVVPFAVLFALGAVAARRPLRVSLPVLAGALGVSALNVRTAPNEDTLFTMALCVAAWALGEAARNRQSAIEEGMRRAVADEQARIARELHDVIAHSVSVIVVQAAAADDVFDERPDQARDALRAIEASARETLGELRLLLADVRPGADGEAGTRPQPGLDRLDDLAEPLRAAGLEVAVRREGAARSLPASVDLSAYRIVQEALTNTLRHARATRAEVTVRYGDDGVEVDVRDDGRGVVAAGAETTGHGLLGMRERATLHGGTLEAGPLPRGGYRVHARLPLEAAAVTIRVLLADDQALVRGGFRMILEAREDLEVVAEAADGAEAAELSARLRPDVVLMDVRMPEVDGIEATRRIVGSGAATRVIVLTTYDADEYVFAALRAGASGFMLKDVRPAELVDAVRVVAGGDALLAPSVTRKLLDRFAGLLPEDAPPPPDLAELTEREVEVLRLVALALSNAEIAERLVLTEATVKTHVSSVLRKLGLRDRVQAVVLAYDVGLVRPRPA